MMEGEPFRKFGEALSGLLRGGHTVPENGGSTAAPTAAGPNPQPGNGPADELRASALGRVRVEDVMVPRSDIRAIELGTHLDEVMKAFRACKHSRLPVYHETLDSPRGFLHLKDLVLDPDWPLRNPRAPLTEHHARRALLVPPSMPADTLLREMQAERIHMALVIDEFGGVDGLVTIEDLVEEIVGEIEDEHDPRAKQGWMRVGVNLYNCDARTEIETLEEACGTRLRPSDWNDDADTLGGLVVALSGRVPQRGEVVTHPEGHEFEILEADPRRIGRIKLSVRQPEHEGAETAK